MSDLMSWTLGACVLIAIATGLAAASVRDTWRTRRAMQIRRRTTGLSWITTHGNFRTESLILALLVALFVIFSSVLMMEAGERRQILTRIAAITVVLILMAKGVFDRHDRSKTARLQYRPPLTIPTDLGLEGGGAVVLDQIGAELYSRLLRDKILKPYFEGVRVSRLMHAQADLFMRIINKQISNVDLRTAHAHLHIPAAHFDRFVDVLEETFDDFEDLPESLSEPILAFVLSVRDDIIDPEAHA